MKKEYDVVIIGSGPAGIFAALELARSSPNPLSALILEKGPLRGFGDRSNKTCGWGGSGAFSDGKLDLTHRVGGSLVEKEFLNEKEFSELAHYVEGIYISYCDSKETILEVQENTEVERVRQLCLNHRMELIPFPVRHLGTDRAFSIVMKMYEDLKKCGVDIMVDTEAISINCRSNGFEINWKNSFGAEGIVFAKKCNVSSGREGDQWSTREFKKLGVSVLKNRVDIGARVEVPSWSLKKLTDLLHEPKIIYRTKDFGDRVRTFCVCPNGYVVRESYRNIEVVSVNGESNSKSGKQSSSTNFAILVSQEFTHPFDDPVAYAAGVARLTNLLAGKNGVLVQRFGDVKQFRRSTENRIKESTDYGFIEQTLKDATPGDLSLAIPARHWRGIIEMLDALDWIAPGIASPHTLIYGAEVKFYSVLIETDKRFETSIPGLYVSGDGSGLTRGLLQASIQGVMVARHIIEDFFGK